MIGTDEMSSTGMDISESFRPEDLSKTDFFDFVTAPDMGIGIGVGVSLHSHHHHSHERTSASSMTHDGGGGADSRGGGNIAGNNTNNNNNSNTSDPTLQGYEFWHTDKEHSRLESTIFEDLDRYCWQQQQATTLPYHSHHSPANTHSAHTTSPPNHQLCTNSAAAAASTSASSSSAAAGVATSSSSGACNSQSNSGHHNAAASSSGGGGSISQPSSAGTTVSSIENTDGQIYTITVLNGNEPWMKREPDSQLPSTLDLDSLLGNFPGYIKSEYPYDDSGFSTDGTKDANGDVANGLSSLSQVVASHHGLSAVASVGQQSLPSLVTAISGASGGASTTNIGQQLAQFQNNNNDWHMADHNAEQNSAESLLRSALQCKGYSKGLHMQNGITLLPSSPSVKDEDMRRILFPPDTDSLAFADSTLNTAQIFEDAQQAAHHSHLAAMQQHSPAANGGPIATTSNHSNTGAGAGVSSIIVDDMFLSLENAFNDDFEKIKRIANEVQQFCSGGPSAVDYAGSGGGDVMMQISPSTTAHQLQHLHSPALTTTATTTTIGGPPPPLHMQPQPLKSEVTTSTSAAVAAATTTAPSAGRITTGKSTKKYKRAPAAASSSSLSSSAAATHSSINHNNNNPNVINQNNTNANSNNNVNGGGSNTNNAATANNANNNSSGSSSSNSSNSPTHCNNGQRKERSLHYCSMCSKGFKDKYSVNVHIRTHTGEKPFACSLCGKSFRQKAHLAKHYQTHMAQKNNGAGNGVIKGSGGSAGKHRSTATSSGPAAIVSSAVAPPPQQQHRQLSIVGVTSLNSMGSNVIGGSGGGGGGVIGAGLPPLNCPTPTTSATILPPANGLLANR